MSPAELPDGLVETLQPLDVPFQLSDRGTQITDVLAMFFLAPAFVVQAIMFTAQRGCLFLQRVMFGLEIGRNIAFTAARGEVMLNVGNHPTAPVSTAR